jgi:hypothetical protein
MAKSTEDADSVAGAHNTGPLTRREAAAHYREYAAQIRGLADTAGDDILRNSLRAIANQYDALADRLEAEEDPET